MRESGCTDVLLLGNDRWALMLSCAARQMVIASDTPAALPPQRYRLRKAASQAMATHSTDRKVMAATVRIS